MIAMQIRAIDKVRGVAAAICMALAGPSAASQAQEVAVPAAIQQAARQIASELATYCPLAPAGDTAAYNACRKALYGPSALRAHLPDFLLWGRQSKNANATLRQTNLT